MKNRIIHFGASLTLGEGLDRIDQSYPCILKVLTNIETIISAKPGLSNLEILYNILNFNFKENDICIPMWVPNNRDLLFERDKLITVGAWQETELVKNWLATHSDYDLGVKSWYYIHHAILYLNSINVKVYNFASYAFILNRYKPDYMNIDLLESNIDKFKTVGKPAKDGHPGVQAHILLAEHIYRTIKC
jgi:hypothetical protein